MSDQEIILTEDGSHSVRNTALEVTYHSTFGAVQESSHIFIESGLKQQIINKENLSILEMGFGTGLNMILTYITSEQYPVNIYYEAIEKYPLSEQLAEQLNYLSLLNREDLDSVFKAIHQSREIQGVNLSDNFTFVKRYDDIQSCSLSGFFDIIYFDAFDPVTQPDLWTSSVFEKLYTSLNDGGILLTYCSKTIVRRAMEAAGFRIEKIRGPKGKREIVRAHK